MTAAIALGSNLGDRASYLDAALRAMGSLPHTALLAASEFLETEPVGDPDQGPYLNAAALLRTELAPHGLLAALQSIERAHGRDRARERRWGPRTLDLDLLVYADLVLDEPGLTIPHPRMHERAFVLRPLVLIAPELVVPGRGPVADLLAGL
ncbi:MAG: 2-amino-4-hydroxy-6-hydroxymethyldihydropteridine diphosphokinase [Tepidisphaera sp.]|nr:2-amino-4-hydroxy-6-hydroxymethyldihydropteridine diphosphokinase [Tepidisphaera sp.]